MKNLPTQTSTTSPHSYYMNISLAPLRLPSSEPPLIVTEVEETTPALSSYVPPLRREVQARPAHMIAKPRGRGVIKCRPRDFFLLT